MKFYTVLFISLFIYSIIGVNSRCVCSTEICDVPDCNLCDVAIDDCIKSHCNMNDIVCIGHCLANEGLGECVPCVLCNNKDTKYIPSSFLKTNNVSKILNNDQMKKH
jgi:hypothetical protein